MLDITVEGYLGSGIFCIIIGLICVFIRIVDSENFIRWITRKPHNEPTGITKPQKGNLFFLIAGIFFFVLGVFFISINIISSLKLKPTPSPSDTPIPTLAPTFTATSTFTPTVTPEITFPYEEFINSCIPDSWQFIPQELMALNSLSEVPCKTKYEKFGFTPNELDLTINNSPNAYTKIIGLARSLPEDNWEVEIILTSSIYHTGLSEPGNSLQNTFFIGLYDPSATEGSNFLEMVSFHDTDVSDRTELRMFGVHKANYSSSYPLLINCQLQDTTLLCEASGWSSDGISADKTTQSYTLSSNSSWTNLFLGYDLRPESVLDVKITHLRITPVE